MGNLDGANLQNSNLSATRFGPTTQPWAEVYSLKGDPRHPWRTVNIVGANLRGIDTKGADCTGSDIARGQHDKALYWTRW